MLILMVVSATGFVIGRLFSVTMLLTFVLGLVVSMMLTHVVRQSDLHVDLAFIVIDVLCLEVFYVMGALIGWFRPRPQ